MGCGHGKISIIYSRKSKSKRSSKKSEAPEKSDSEEEDGTEKEKEKCITDEDDQEKKNQIKASLGPILPPIDISTSQQDFFKMLDEKIENGPDYNSESESEIVAEHQRITALLKDWESTSVGSRSSLNQTPLNQAKSKKRTIHHDVIDGPTNVFNDSGGIQCNNNVMTQRPSEVGRSYIVNSVQGAQSVIHQNYGVSLLQDPKHQQQFPTQPYFHPQQQPYQQPQPHIFPQPQQAAQYRQVYNNYNYVMHQPSPQNVASYPTQYQVMSPMYSHVTHPPLTRQHPSYNQYAPVPGVASRSQPYGPSSQQVSSSSTRNVVPKPVPDFSNGVMIQPRFSSPGIQFKGTREQPQVHFQNSPPQQQIFIEQHPQAVPILVKANNEIQTQHQQMPVTFQTVPIVVKTNNEVTYVPRKQFP